jgi:hypothetical protein
LSSLFKEIERERLREGKRGHWGGRERGERKRDREKEGNRENG